VFVEMVVTCVTILVVGFLVVPVSVDVEVCVTLGWTVVVVSCGVDVVVVVSSGVVVTCVDEPGAVGVVDVVDDVMLTGVELTGVDETAPEGLALLLMIAHVYRCLW